MAVTKPLITRLLITGASAAIVAAGMTAPAAEAESAPTAAHARELPPIKSPTKAVLKGEAKVGKKLSVSFKGSWAKGAKLRYEWWTKDSSAFLGNKPTLKLIKGLKGYKVVCYVSGSKAGKESVTLLAGPSKKIKG